MQTDIGVFPAEKSAGKRIVKNLALHIVSIAFLLVTAWLSSCKPKYICPAYQSAFYLDQKAAAIEFTAFDKDTMPKLERIVRKNDVLLIVRLGKKKTENRMAVIPMITIYPEADSAIASSDSLGSDSLAADDLVPDEDGELITDSTGAGDEELNADKEPAQEEGADENPDAEPGPEEQAKPGKQEKKGRKKQEEKDPEISDPGLKFEFEESFEDSVSEKEYLDDVPEENDVPSPRNDEKRKAIQDPDADKPKEEEEQPADDGKF